MKEKSFPLGYFGSIIWKLFFLWLVILRKCPVLFINIVKKVRYQNWRQRGRREKRVERKEGRQKRKQRAILFKSQVNLFSACICKSSVGNNTLGIALEFKVYWKDLINLSLVKMLAAVFLHHHFWNVSRYQWMWTSFTYRWIDNPTKKD